ncbi:MAG TPA: bifunctional serine/threonine-protein kinase/formylglycine-generating enzyme family protein, partial [Blastocatellia bacterium]|nr:bifunctional serine/threonine-protein kinase/formylglycine-generating enzyme family protein [Blastocatellia bacterium]
VMDYIEGRTLADLVREGGVDPDYGARILDQVLSGLDAIHRRGIVHRDLKAGNILIDQEGSAFISDFGIAEFINGRSESPPMASAKCVAPEIIDPALGRGAADEQVDIYAAGMVAYEMLLGENSFREAFPEVYNGSPDGSARRWLDWHTDMARHAPNLNELDPKILTPVASVIERMMAKDINERYRRAGEARRDLAPFLNEARDARHRRYGPDSDDRTMPLDRMRGGGQAPPSRPLDDAPPTPTAPRGGPPPGPPGRARRIPSWAWWTGGGVALLGVIGFVLFFVLLRDPGFTLVVRGAPAGSDIYVDNIRRGVTRADGTIRVPGLESGKRLVRVAHEGFTDFNTSVTGEDGDVKSVIAELAASETRPAVQTEIDYNGPMIFIPAGEFIMGSDNHDANEKPAHKVTLPDFYIDKFEVSNAQYKKFCDETSRPYPSNPFWDNQYFKNNPTSPVVGVNWNDAADYARWVGKRLPTEEEWEKAASWGPDAQKKRLWTWGDAPDQGRVGLGLNRPAASGQSPSGASAYGVQDLAGSVAEWVDSYFQPYPGNQTSDPNYGTRNKVVRGGHFRSTIDEVRTTARYYNSPEFTSVEKKERTWLIGFRCAVSGDDPKLQQFLSSRTVTR